MKYICLIVVWIIIQSISIAQPYTDYIGAGHNKGIVVTTSSDDQRGIFPQKAEGQKTISGEGLTGKKNEMARFLTQAAFGFSETDLTEATESGIENWLENQFLLPESQYEERMDSFALVLYQYYLANGEDPENLSSDANWVHFRYAWWDINTFGEDQLRQRMAYALSQILVISDDGNIGSFAKGLAAYYQLLSKHAFGNYRDLLYDITLHPAMGSYLSHLNNPKEIPEENIHPDQNFAREIMQLFTIGLFELNMDGTRKVDGDGNHIPTYNNKDIEELAKVFTGLGIGKNLPGMGEPSFGNGLYGADVTVPMKMYEEWHQQGEKQFLGSSVPAGQTGIEDISDALDILFNHPNTSPFVSRLLIQRFVTSNPSPQYIRRVSQVFANDGFGVRGNLKAVIKAILLDEEARSCEWSQNPRSGKMTEPVLRHTHFLKAVGVTSPSGYFLNLGSGIENNAFQHPLSSPSVFNFYLPDHIPTGILSEEGLFAPEFQILNTLSSLDYANLAFSWNYYESTINNWENEYFGSATNASAYYIPAQDDEVLINHIDQIFTNGRMSQETRAIIKEAIGTMLPTLYGTREKINLAMYLTLISPDYIIKK
jgi:uncharacterized protein (DUF1800 family)